MATFEIEQLRSVLSSLGIHQAFHLKEEADDVIATLVRGLLKGRKNLIVSTDRDLLQLVTATDHQLVPAVGVGKEKLYDVEAVLQEYGVSPEWVTSVRALTGDTSDDIPGPGGFGLKTASKLIQMYGSVQALLDSNLAGLTPTQYTKLRASEKQVKLNLELLRLVDDLHITLVGPNPDQTAVSQRLRELDIKVDPVLAVFIPTGPQVLHAS
jgi:DNA polymerase-1